LSRACLGKYSSFFLLQALRIRSAGVHILLDCNGLLVNARHDILAQQVPS
jgi:hypothetical protein